MPIRRFAVQVGRIGNPSYESGYHAEALAAIPTMTVVPLFDTAENESIRTILTVKKGETDLTSSDTEFTNTGKFGFGGGGWGASGGVSQDLQGTYDLSITPEIITDSTRGALSVRQGSG